MTNRWMNRCVNLAQVPGLRTGAILLFASAVVVACAPAATPPSSAPTASGPAVRVIARFAPAVLDPLDADFLARLAALSRVTRIDPIRPMSGNAYVLQVACVDPQASRPSDDPCASAVARLSRSDAVLGIEVDRREKHQ